MVPALTNMAPARTAVSPGQRRLWVACVPDENGSGHPLHVGHAAGTVEVPLWHRVQLVWIRTKWHLYRGRGPSPIPEDERLEIESGRP